MKECGDGMSKDVFAKEGMDENKVEHVCEELILLEQRVLSLSIVQQRTLKALELLTNHMNTMETIE